MLKRTEESELRVGVHWRSCQVFGRISNTQKFSPHCAIGAVAAGAKSQPSAIALAWLFFSGETLLWRDQFGPSIANH